LNAARHQVAQIGACVVVKARFCRSPRQSAVSAILGKQESITGIDVWVGNLRGGTQTVRVPVEEDDGAWLAGRGGVLRLQIHTVFRPRRNLLEGAVGLRLGEWSVSVDRVIQQVPLVEKEDCQDSQTGITCAAGLQQRRPRGKAHDQSNSGSRRGRNQARRKENAGFFGGIGKSFRRLFGAE
jgi:hypothetical protein